MLPDVVAEQIIERNNTRSPTLTHDSEGDHPPSSTEQENTSMKFNILNNVGTEKNSKRKCSTSLIATLEQSDNLPPSNAFSPSLEHKNTSLEFNILPDVEAEQVWERQNTLSPILTHEPKGDDPPSSTEQENTSIKFNILHDVGIRKNTTRTYSTSPIPTLEPEVHNLPPWDVSSPSSEHKNCLLYTSDAADE